jgi:hypothetical protein
LAGKVKTGFIDVSNPTDSPLQIQSSVQGFRQTGTQGDLQFFDDADLANAIGVDLKSFQLGPREAVRVVFSVDPHKLPAGGTYAAIFFRTQPAPGSSNTSYVSESANIGTLLILRNGGVVPARGGISTLSAKFWQFSNGITGTTTLRNTASPQGGVAFRPVLTSHILPWGHVASLSSGLILPAATRQFAFARTGSYFGLLPFTVTDGATSTSRTVWVFACTGWYSWLVLVIGVALVILLALRVARRSRKPSGDASLEPPAPQSPETPLEPGDAPEPEAKTVKVPVVKPELIAPVVAAEADAPDPGTVVMPKKHKVPLSAQEPSLKPKVHKVKLTPEKPAPKKKSSPKKPSRRPKRSS